MASADHGAGEVARRFGAKSPVLAAVGTLAVRALVQRLYGLVDRSDPRPLAPLAHGDPSSFACFRTAAAAEEAVMAVVTSGKHNGYPTTAGIPEARSGCIPVPVPPPYKLSLSDIVLSVGCNRAIEIMMAVLTTPGANVLMPRPGYPLYEAHAAFVGLKLRHYDLLPDKGWDVDIEGVEALADENTVAMVIINPNNPCGSVYSKERLVKIAETARKLGVMVINDEIYGHFAFGSKHGRVRVHSSCGDTRRHIQEVDGARLAARVACND